MTTDGVLLGVGLIVALAVGAARLEGARICVQPADGTAWQAPRTVTCSSGRLQYTVYKGTNLIRQEAVAKTDERAVAYKYDAGLKGLTIEQGRARSGATSPIPGRTISSAATRTSAKCR